MRWQRQAGRCSQSMKRVTPISTAQLSGDIATQNRQAVGGRLGAPSPPEDRTIISHRVMKARPDVHQEVCPVGRSSTQNGQTG